MVSSHWTVPKMQQAMNVFGYWKAHELMYKCLLVVFRSPGTSVAVPWHRCGDHSSGDHHNCLRVVSQEAEGKGKWEGTRTGVCISLFLIQYFMPRENVFFVHMCGYSFWFLSLLCSCFDQHCIVFCMFFLRQSTPLFFKIN